MMGVIKVGKCSHGCADGEQNGEQYGARMVGETESKMESEWRANGARMERA